MDPDLELIISAKKNLLRAIECTPEGEDVCKFAVQIAHVNMALERFPSAAVTRDMNIAIAILAGRALRKLAVGSDGKVSLDVLAKSLYDKTVIDAVLPGCDDEGVAFTAMMLAHPDEIRQLAGFVPGKPCLESLARLVPVFAAAMLSARQLRPYDLAYLALGDEEMARVIGFLMEAVLPKGGPESSPAAAGSAAQ